MGRAGRADAGVRAAQPRSAGRPGRSARQIDAYHEARTGQPIDAAGYEAFLREIGYIQPEPDAFRDFHDGSVDDEIASIAGPQLVVPTSNARYALNAANARWGSLYDALYGTDAISEEGGADPLRRLQQAARRSRLSRGRASFSTRRRRWLGQAMRDATSYRGPELARSQVELKDGSETGARDAGAIRRLSRRCAAEPSAILLRHNGLHIEIKIDRNSPIGADDPAGVADLVIESAISTIMDLEDSVAAVDADDKVLVYRTWLGLMKGDLVRAFREGRSHDRAPAQPGPDLYGAGRRRASAAMDAASCWCAMSATTWTPTRCWTRPATRFPKPSSTPPSPSLIAIHDLKATGEIRNSRAGSVYIVKPKMHGPGRGRVRQRSFRRRRGHAVAAATTR